MLNFIFNNLQFIAIAGLAILALRSQYLLDGNSKVSVHIGLCGLLLIVGFLAPFVTPNNMSQDTPLKTAIFNGLGLSVIVYACWQLLAKAQLNQSPPPSLSTQFFPEYEMSYNLRTFMDLMD